MPIQIDSTSRFLISQPIIHANHETFGLWRKPPGLDITQIDEHDISTILIDQNLAGRPDQIAVREYGTPLLEWVIVMFNRPLNPFGWPRVGDVIKIPSRSIIRNII